MKILQVSRAYFRALRRAIREIHKERAATLASSTAFFAFLSVFPFFLFVLSIGGLFIDKSAVLARFEQYLKALPEGVSATIMSVLRGTFTASGVLSVVSFLFLVYSAFMVFTQLRMALNRIMGFERPRKGWLVTLKTFSFFLITAFLLVLVVLSGSALLVMAAKLGRLPLVDSYFFVLPTYVLFEGLFLSFSYRYLSYGRFSFKPALAGGFTAALLWEAFKHLFGWYISAISTFSALPASIGSITILQLWLYYSVLVYFLGARLSLCLGERGLKKDA